MGRRSLSFEVSRPRQILKRKHRRCSSSAYSPNQCFSSPKNPAQYLFSIWAKCMMFSFAFQIFQTLSVKCTVLVEIPRRELFSFPRRIAGTIQASKNYFRTRLDTLMTLRRKFGTTSQGSQLYFGEPWRRWRSSSGNGSLHANAKRDLSSSGTSGQQWKTSGFTVPGLKYFRSLKWTPIPISVGFALLAYQHYKRVVRRGQQGHPPVEEGVLAQDWEITCYRCVPWNSLSRVWGWVNSVNLPIWARQFVLKWYVKTFNCDISEADIQDLSFYQNLGEFFRRPLKTGVRPVDRLSPLVSPADGTVLHFGAVNCGKIEQVKGVTYSLPAFLGPPTWDTPGRDSSLTQNNSTMLKVNGEQFCAGILKEKAGRVLHYCVIYLAPGDYHHFHSPANWDVKFRRHFGGELLSVNPTVARWIGGLFSLNERAIYVGNWEHGFFSMTAVGATNVGSIHVYGDPDLHTNSKFVKKNTHEDKWFSKPIHCEKGEDIGQFNLGSTIVLLFEAPPTFKFNLEPGQKVKVGQSMSGRKPDVTSLDLKESMRTAIGQELVN